MKDFKAMMGKEDEGKEGMKKDAKLNVLKHLRKMASDMMGDDVKGGMMKKVTVAAPTTEALKEGLDKAEEVVEEMPGEEADYTDDMDMENCTPEELKAKIAELQAMLAEKES